MNQRSRPGIIVTIIAGATFGLGTVAWAIEHDAPATNRARATPRQVRSGWPWPDRTWTYMLLEGSQLVDDCYCGRPAISGPMRGTFELRLLSLGPLFATYAVTNIAFTASLANQTYKVSGHGTYQVGGEVALLQDLSLQTEIHDGTASRPCGLANLSRAVPRLWPMLEAQVHETNPPAVQFYWMDLAAAPLREIWFSTAHGFHAGVWSPPTNQVSAGDLVSANGRLVETNANLTARLGIMPIVSDLGLDALDINPGGEVVFSLTQDDFSETLGPLQAGDLLSAQGRIVRRNQELTRAFNVLPPVPDAGLDAVQTQADGQIFFSIVEDLVAGTGLKLGHGDLLSDAGLIVKRNQDLLARFQPADTKTDFGLDAVHVWPSGEIWFSTAASFYGQDFRRYGPGDLLSDWGYIVFRNLELLGPFAPLEDLADFGLDALFLVSDAFETVPPPLFGVVALDRRTAQLTLTWQGHGRVFQVQQAMAVKAPFVPLSPIMPETSYSLSLAPPSAKTGLYRLQQW
jgi:hypothetical protein